MNDHTDDVDARFSRIVASYDTAPHRGAAVPWPEAEDVDLSRPTACDAPPLPAEESATDWDADEHFVPPTPPPVPTPEPLTLLAWVGVLGGPLGFLCAALAGWELPRLLTGALVVGFVGGILTLIARTSASADRNDPDDGAVV